MGAFDSLVSHPRGAFRLSQHQPGALGCMVPPKACLVEHSTKGCVGFIEAADECVGFMAAATGVRVFIVMGTKSAFGSGEQIRPPTPFPRPTHHRDHNSTAVITSTASPPSWSSQPRHHRHHHRSHDPPWVRLACWSVTQEGAFRLSQHQPGALGCMVPPKACLVEHSTKGCVGFIEAADECVGFMAAATGVRVFIIMGTKSTFGSGE
ncbi:hypothetical protein Tco_1219212 [Tanacetum coccineum]